MRYVLRTARATHTLPPLTPGISIWFDVTKTGCLTSYLNDKHPNGGVCENMESIVI